MADEREDLLKEIESHRAALGALERRLQAIETAPAAWPPQEFYFVYHVVAGMMIGILGALVSFFFNVVGSMLVDQDPMKLIRVFGTFFIGEEALTTSDLNFLMLVLMAHFSVGAVAGAIFHVVVNRRFATRSYEWKVVAGGLCGLGMWVFIFYMVVSWLQPMMVGQAYVLKMIPFWVAAVTHLVYGVTIGLLEPVGRFVPYRAEK